MKNEKLKMTKLLKSELKENELQKLTSSKYLSKTQLKVLKMLANGADFALVPSGLLNFKQPFRKVIFAKGRMYL